MRLPVLGDVIRDRDRLRGERDRLRAERDGLRVERASLLKQRDEATAKRDRLQEDVNLYRTWVPPGHFYSPVPSPDEVRSRGNRIFDRAPRDLPAIDLDEPGQLALLEQLKAFYAELPFTEEGSPEMRYYYENLYYSYADAIILYSMIRHLAPKRIIEVGSGYSSAVILDTNERFFGGAISCTFVEPFPDRMTALLKPGDEAANELIPSPVQDIDPQRFTELDAGDILFIDSTHVSKTGSDVNHLFLEVLPRLRSGVWVHVHDVFYPFEYPEEWVYEGRAWNESYMLRAFLAFNEAFRIRFFATYMMTAHEDWFAREMPLCLRNPGGNIWLQRV